MTKTTYSNETKAAVLAALLAGQSISAVAREWNIPKGTVHAWKKREPFTQAPETKKPIGELLLDYLSTNLQTLKRQSIFFRDETWLKLQSASELAVLHGVLADKTVRLLEAMSKNDDA